MPNFQNTLSTLEYLINVGVCLLIFEQNSTQHELILYHTFIDLGKFFQSTLKIEQKTQYLIVNVENIHTIFIIFSPHTIIHTIRLLIFTQFSTQYAYSKPYVYQIFQSKEILIYMETLANEHFCRSETRNLATFY